MPSTTKSKTLNFLLRVLYQVLENYGLEQNTMNAKHIGYKIALKCVPEKTQKGVEDITSVLSISFLKHILKVAFKQRDYAPDAYTTGTMVDMILSHLPTISIPRRIHYERLFSWCSGCSSCREYVENKYTRKMEDKDYYTVFKHCYGCCYYHDSYDSYEIRDDGNVHWGHCARIYMKTHLDPASIKVCVSSVTLFPFSKTFLNRSTQVSGKQTSKCPTGHLHGKTALSIILVHSGSGTEVVYSLHEKECYKSKRFLRVYV